MKPEERVQTDLACLLAWVGGGVDAVGFLVLFGLFTAQMSGNSTAMGAMLGQGHWREGLIRAYPIGVFVAGSAIGAWVMEAERRKEGRGAFGAVLAFEALLLIVFWALGSSVMRGGVLRPSHGGAFFALAGLPSFAMGMQSVTLRKVGGLSVGTTYITGTLSGLAQNGVKFLARRDESDGKNARVGAAVWSAYLAGAVVSSFAETHWLLGALALSIAALLVAAGLSVHRRDELAKPD